MLRRACVASDSYLGQAGVRDQLLGCVRELATAALESVLGVTQSVDRDGCSLLGRGLVGGVRRRSNACWDTLRDSSQEGDQW